jgi:hypothetical protein
MVQYDPTVIHKFAQRLYDRALLSTIAWAIGGVVIVGVAGKAMSVSLNVTDGSLTAVGAVVGLVIGFLIGSHRSFMLKLQAQQALCLLQIEMNTRPVGTYQQMPPNR